MIFGTFEGTGFMPARWHKRYEYVGGQTFRPATVICVENNDYSEHTLQSSIRSYIYISFETSLRSIGETRMKLELAIIGLMSLLLLSSVPTDGAQSNMSISIGGHTFTTSLDDNWTANQANVINYNPQKYFADSLSRFEMTN